MPIQENNPSNNTIPSGDAVAAKKTHKRHTAHTHRSAGFRKERKERLFALDIGTRSVIGIVAEKEAAGLKIVATERQEHTTRAMLDGQIHDVPQVAAIIKKVKDALAKKTGPLQHAAVAAAGRALYTMTAEAEIETGGIITPDQERSLDFAGVQAAQTSLAASNTIEDPTTYYCVGYSTIKYILDGVQLKTLVGQRGKIAKATVIATFLPRQVIDSMQSALHEARLDMRALTLEPIAAISVLIPPTMRHLNLVLVDIGAGTSDVAITKNGSVIAYGMVPLAGDEITEAISQKYLLDFNIAEQIKRDAAEGQNVQFSDILGTNYDLSPKEIFEPILPSIKNLADAIAKQIIELNGAAPQAVLLVGGGSLTPHLPKFVAEALSMPENRVAVRSPDTIDGIQLIPPELRSPDAVTPLGILKVASLNTLHFLSVYVNEEEYSLFNFRDLMVSDALLNAGINLKKLNGHPGLGLMLSVNGERRFVPGSLGTFAHLYLDGKDATLDTPIKQGNHITVKAGENGTAPSITLAEILGAAPEYTLFINEQQKHLQPQFLINGRSAESTQLLSDGDIVESKEPKSVGEALLAAGYSPTGRKIKYLLNGNHAQYTISPDILLNDAPATLSMPVHENDRLEYIAPPEAKLSDILNISELEAFLVIYFNKVEYKIPSSTLQLEVNGHKASLGTIIEEGSSVSYIRSERKSTTVSEALLAVGFQPPAATSRVTVTLLVNSSVAEFTSPIKNGDTLDVVIKPIEKEPLASHSNL
jgi:cell division protein FtsA